jgi:hypothetical protein
VAESRVVVCLLVFCLQGRSPFNPVTAFVAACKALPCTYRLYLDLKRLFLMFVLSWFLCRCGTKKMHPSGSWRDLELEYTFVESKSLITCAIGTVGCRSGVFYDQE